MGTLSTHHHDSKPPFLITSTFLGRDSKSPVRESNYLPPPLFVNSFCSFAQEALLKKVSGQESPTPPSLRQTLSADRGYPPPFTRLVVTVFLILPAPPARFQSCFLAIVIDHLSLHLVRFSEHPDPSRSVVQIRKAIRPPETEHLSKTSFKAV